MDFVDTFTDFSYTVECEIHSSPSEKFLQTY